MRGRHFSHTRAEMIRHMKNNVPSSSSVNRSLALFGIPLSELQIIWSQISCVYEDYDSGGNYKRKLHDVVLYDREKWLLNRGYFCNGTLSEDRRGIHQYQIDRIERSFVDCPDNEITVEEWRDRWDVETTMKALNVLMSPTCYLCRNDISNIKKQRHWRDKRLCLECNSYISTRIKKNDPKDEYGTETEFYEAALNLALTKKFKQRFRPRFNREGFKVWSQSVKY
jgi:hypothetical protein